MIEKNLQGSLHEPRRPVFVATAKGPHCTLPLRSNLIRIHDLNNSLRVQPFRIMVADGHGRYWIITGENLFCDDTYLQVPNASSSVDRCREYQVRSRKKTG